MVIELISVDVNMKQANNRMINMNNMNNLNSYNFILFLTLSLIISSCATAPPSADIPEAESNASKTKAKLVKPIKRDGFFVRLEKSQKKREARQLALANKRKAEKLALKKKRKMEIARELATKVAEQKRIENAILRQKNLDTIMSGNSNLIDPPEEFNQSRKEGKVYGNRQQSPIILGTTQ